METKAGVAKTTQAESMMNDFSQNASRLGNLIDRLDNRLAPICRGCRPAEPEKNCEAISLPDYFNHGFGINKQFASYCDRLEDILDRLEI